MHHQDFNAHNAVAPTLKPSAYCVTFFQGRRYSGSTVVQALSLEAARKDVERFLRAGETVTVVQAA